MCAQYYYILYIKSLLNSEECVNILFVHGNVCDVRNKWVEGGDEYNNEVKDLICGANLFRYKIDT